MDSETQRAPSGRWPEYHVQQHDGHQGRCHGQREHVEAVVFHAPQLTGATARSCDISASSQGQLTVSRDLTWPERERASASLGGPLQSACYLNEQQVGEANQQDDHPEHPKPNVRRVVVHVKADCWQHRIA